MDNETAKEIVEKYEEARTYLLLKKFQDLRWVKKAHPHMFATVLVTGEECRDGSLPVLIFNYSTCVIEVKNWNTDWAEKFIQDPDYFGEGWILTTQEEVEKGASILINNLSKKIMARLE